MTHEFTAKSSVPLFFAYASHLLVVLVITFFFLILELFQYRFDLKIILRWKASFYFIYPGADNCRVVLLTKEILISPRNIEASLISYWQTGLKYKQRSNVYPLQEGLYSFPLWQGVCAVKSNKKWTLIYVIHICYQMPLLESTGTPWPFSYKSTPRLSSAVHSEQESVVFLSPMLLCCRMME